VPSLIPPHTSGTLAVDDEQVERPPIGACRLDPQHRALDEDERECVPRMNVADAHAAPGLAARRAHDELVWTRFQPAQLEARAELSAADGAADELEGARQLAVRPAHSSVDEVCAAERDGSCVGLRVAIDFERRALARLALRYAKGLVHPVDGLRR